MKFGSIVSAIILSQAVLIFGVNGANEQVRLRSPQCVNSLNKYQIDTLHHFNGIFGNFKVSDGKISTFEQASIYGPIAAINITTSNYEFNTMAQKTNCSVDNGLLRYGLVAKNANIDGESEIVGDAWTENGSFGTAKVTANQCPKIPLKVQDPSDDFLQSLWSFAPTAITHTSTRLANFDPDTSIKSVNTGLETVNKVKSFKGYRILKLPACSDRKCATTEKQETSPDVLKGGKEWSGLYKGIPSNEMIVFNIPVYIGSTYTISTLDVNKNISPCQAVYNFYPVDQSGNLVTDSSAYFTLVRSPDVIISGTILAPQARIIDAKTGYFGGQLITLDTYTGNGASIKDFNAVSKGKCTSQSLCWPIGPHVVVEVVTVSDISTETNTLTRVATHTESISSTRTVIQEQHSPSPLILNAKDPKKVKHAKRQPIEAFDIERIMESVEKYKVEVVTDVVATTTVESVKYEPDPVSTMFLYDIVVKTEPKSLEYSMSLDESSILY